ncbi:hypothetical protein N431DRAFT_229028 [Stipitochalara longipes BDJ]|nr:hypothetical protein N431DRAFT_229028 [Stipitochalara longipes BDJ]
MHRGDYIETLACHLISPRPRPRPLPPAPLPRELPFPSPHLPSPPLLLRPFLLPSPGPCVGNGLCHHQFINQPVELQHPWRHPRTRLPRDQHLTSTDQGQRSVSIVSADSVSVSGGLCSLL